MNVAPEIKNGFLKSVIYSKVILCFPGVVSIAKRASTAYVVLTSLPSIFTFQCLSYGIVVNIISSLSTSIVPSILLSLYEVYFISPFFNNRGFPRPSGFKR